MWMACYSTDEIAEVENIGKATVSEVCSELAELPKPNKSAADHATDFHPPIYNIWKQQTKSERADHGGPEPTRRGVDRGKVLPLVDEGCPDIRTGIRNLRSTTAFAKRRLGNPNPLGILANAKPAPERVHPHFQRMQFALRVVQRAPYAGLAPAGDRSRHPRI